IAIGGGADGEGGASPLPCLHLPRITVAPTPPALHAPPPSCGAGAVCGDSRWEVVSGSSRVLRGNAREKSRVKLQMRSFSDLPYPTGYGSGAISWLFPHKPMD